MKRIERMTNQYHLDVKHWILPGFALRYVAVAVCALVTVEVLPIPAQSLSVQITRVESEHYPTVKCYVSVTDEDGESLTGLTKKNFTVAEDNLPATSVQISSLLQGHQRIAAVLVIDHSGSMKGNPLRAAKQAAVEFANRLSKEDSLGVIPFSTRATVAASLTTKHDDALRPLDTMQASGNTALYDAIEKAVAQLSGQVADRKAVVALTDGQDNASSSTAWQCAKSASDNGIALYCVGLGPTVNAKGLEIMSNQSGGRCFLTKTSQDLTAIYRRIARAIQSQYCVAFESPNADVKTIWRTVEVSVNEAGLEGAARRQYPGLLRPGGDVLATEDWLKIGLVAVGCLNLLLIALLCARLIRRRAKPSSSEDMAP